MKPTFTIYNRADDSETLVFECRHATTRAEHAGGDGDTLRAAVGLVIARHGETCRCQPAVLEDMHESLAYERQRVQRDILAADESTDPRVLMLAHAKLDALAHHDCPCDPHVVQRTVRGSISFGVYHRDGCGRELRKGRTYRMLDFGSPGVPS